jgi:2-octaprenyl-6-methoxyphenol hydroxylase
VAETVDIAVAGGGPVGCALAAALASSSLSVARVGGEAAADRPIALSHGSRLILERLRAWDRIRSTPIRAVHVSQRGAFGRTLMTARDVGLPALGYVAPYSAVLAPLAEATPAVGGVLADWSAEADGVRLRLRGGGRAELHARLLVLADGGASAPPDHVREYGQEAVVAEIDPGRPHRNVAWERFTVEGPIALLPFGERLALVWSTRAGTARRLLELPDREFIAALREGFGGKIGAFTRVGPRGAFPLALRYRSAPAAPHVIVIGNAAQTLHPVAGQGLNLGLRDAWELAELLLDTPKDEIGAADVAARFRRRRDMDRRAGIVVTDSLVRLFSNDWPLLGAARGAGLAAFDMLPGARRFLARRMMFGTRALP